MTDEMNQQTNQQTNEQNNFVETKPLTMAQIREVLQEFRGKAIILNSLPDNTHWVLKIRDQPWYKTYEQESGKPKEIGYFPVEYKYNDSTRIPLLLRVSKNCYDKFFQRNQSAEIIGRYAIFSKKKYNDQNVQSIGLCPPDFEPKTFEDLPDPLEMLENAKSASAGEQEEKPDKTLEEIPDFVSRFMKDVATFNKMKEENGEKDKKMTPSKDMCALKFFKEHWPKHYNKIKQQFEQ